MGCRELQYYFSNEANSDYHRGSAAHFEYSPFGKTTVASGSIPNRFVFRFSSEYHDSETGLVYYNYRYYSPELGRWLSRDPIGERGGYNLYAMLGNNTINKIDINGLKEITCNGESDAGNKKDCKIIGMYVLPWGQTPQQAENFKEGAAGIDNFKTFEELVNFSGGVATGVAQAIGQKAVSATQAAGTEIAKYVGGKTQEATGAKLPNAEFFRKNYEDMLKKRFGVDIFLVVKFAECECQKDNTWDFVSPKYKNHKCTSDEPQHFKISPTTSGFTAEGMSAILGDCIKEALKTCD